MNKFTHKILPLISVFIMIFFCFFTSNVQAVSGYGDYKKVVKKTSENNYFSYLLYRDTRDNQIYLATVQDEEHSFALEVWYYNIYFINSTTTNPNRNFGKVNIYKYDSSLNSYIYYKENLDYVENPNDNTLEYIAYNKNFVGWFGDIILPANDLFKVPYIANTDLDLSRISDYLLIFPESCGYNLGDLKLVIRKRETVQAGEVSYDRLSVVYSTDLYVGSNYYKNVVNNGITEEFWYEVPFKDTAIEFAKDEKYVFSLEYLDEGVKKNVDREVTIGSVSEGDKLQDSLIVRF